MTRKSPLHDAPPKGAIESPEDERPSVTAYMDVDMAYVLHEDDSGPFGWIASDYVVEVLP